MSSGVTSGLPVRPEIAASQPYGAPVASDAIALNVNENPYPPPVEVVQAIHERLDRVAGSLNRYPDRDFTELRQGLAWYLNNQHGTGLSPEQIWAANGSNEVMLQLFQAFGGPGRKALSWDPTYSMYPEYARDTNTQWIVGQRTANHQIDPNQAVAQIAQEKPTLVIVANPNNPTGTALPDAVIERLAEATRNQAVLVVDEAYAEFRNPTTLGAPTAIGLLETNPHLIVTRTMSKAFAFAGVRLGYAAANTELINYLRTVRLPYHLSTVTQQVALAGLDNAQLMLAQVAELRQSRDQLARDLAALGYQVPASQANFLLFGPLARRHETWQKLLEMGVLVRETGPDGYLRVTVGTPEQNEKFLAALNAVETLGKGA